jgi:hypothetical protein
MTTKKVSTKLPAQGKADERTAEIQRQMRASEITDLAELIEAVLHHPHTPRGFRQDVREALSEVFNRLDNNDEVTDSAEYIGLLFKQYAAETGGAR